MLNTQLYKQTNDDGDDDNGKTHSHHTCAGSSIATTSTNRSASEGDIRVRRRSTRVRDKNVKSSNEGLIAKALESGSEDGIKIIETVSKGRGVATTRSFHKGDFIAEYKGYLLSHLFAKAVDSHYDKCHDVGCFMFWFSHGGEKYCIDATEETSFAGRLINHSRLRPNLVPKIFVDEDDIPHVIFKAKFDIGADVELLYDYGDNTKENVKHNPWLQNT